MIIEPGSSSANQMIAMIRFMVFWGLVGVLFIAVVDKWGFNFGFNLKFSEVALLILAPVMFCYIGLAAQCIALPRALWLIIVVKSLYLVSVALSVLPILLTPIDADSLGFYLKGILQLSIHLVFMFLLVFVIARFPEKRRRTLLYVQIAAVSCSAAYGLLQGAALFFKGVDLDVSISRFLEPFTGGQGASLAPYAYGAFYRLTGFAGDPNVQAAYSITAVPLIVALFLLRPRWYLAVLLGLNACMIAFTMSVSGTVGLLVSLVMIFWYFYRPKTGHILYFICFIVVSAYAFSVFKAEIVHLYTVRTDPSGTATTHLDIAIQSLRIYLKYPLGVGYNNFSLAWKFFSTTWLDRAMNPHNTFIAILVETGPLALACELFTYSYMAFIAFRKGTVLAKVFLSSLVGMCVAAVGYQTLDMFYAQLFVFTFFTIVATGDRVSGNQAKCMQNLC